MIPESMPKKVKAQFYEYWSMYSAKNNAGGAPKASEMSVCQEKGHSRRKPDLSHLPETKEQSG